MKKQVTYLSLLIALILTGCAGLRITPLSADTYMASKTSAGGVFVSMASIKTEVIQAANAFAKEKGKVAVPIASAATPAAPMQNPSFEYQFRLVDPDSPMATGGALLPRADTVIQSTENSKVEVELKNQAGDNIYDQLIRLKHLKDEGVLTEEEFKKEKEKILSGSK